MRKGLFVLAVISCLLALSGVTAYAQTSVTLTQGGEDDGSVTVVDWGAADADNSAVPVRDAPAEPTPVSVDTVTENGVTLVKKTYEVSPDTDPQALVRAFERNGYTFTAREILRRELPGETLSRPAQKTADALSDTDEESEIMLNFPGTIDYEEDGYAGQLHLDGSTVTTDADEYENYTYPYTKTREIPGLDRNDPSYIEKEWNGMVLSGVTFRQGADGRYTATASYKGTATGSRPAGYVTTAVYRGEITKTVPGNILYMVVYEGSPIAPPVALPTGEETPQTDVPPPPDDPDADGGQAREEPAGSGSPALLFLIAAGFLFLIGAVAVPLYAVKQIRMERNQNREMLEEIKKIAQEKGRRESAV
jgi:hypothetical protein